MDKQVILSLYGDAPTQPTHPHSPDAAGTLLRGSASGPARCCAGTGRTKRPGFRHGRPQKVLGETFANGNGSR